MAHATLQKLACKSTDISKVYSSDLTQSNLSDVLESEPVKRLFNQPNIIIKTIPLNLHGNFALNNNIIIDKRNGLTSDLNKTKRLEVSEISPTEENKEDENLLPSKKEGKSEISLLPLKKKSCGHHEPCENIVCDVLIQQYVDSDGILPMLATEISDNDTNPPVFQHCNNKNCDALSIDHNRCRRAIIKLYRCNKTKACDICGIKFESRKSRVQHKNCTRKNAYRHNETDGAQILKEKMREREIQMIEASKAKKKDYMDPINGPSLAMETLRNNEELIIIPKPSSVQQPIITITSMPSTQPPQQVQNVKGGFGKLLPNLPIVLPQQNIVFSKTPCSNENSVTTPQPVTLADASNKPFITTSNTIPLPQNQYIRIAPQNNTQTIAINDLLLSQSQIVTTTPIQSKPFLTPIRVVPITNLITQPSLMHQKQGIPKFCIMADNSVGSVTMSTPQAVRAQSTPKTVDPKGLLRARKKILIKKKRRLKMKDFKCDYCLKRFSTDWYFKIHVAKHKSAKRFSCTGCTESFTNKSDLSTHMRKMHSDEDVLDNLSDKQSPDESYECEDEDNEYPPDQILNEDRENCHADEERAKETEDRQTSSDVSDELTEKKVPPSITKTNCNDRVVNQEPESEWIC